MTDAQWKTVRVLLAHGWQGKFGPGEDRAYRVLLDGYESEQVATALRRLVAKGAPYMPTPSEIVQAINDDPDRPTFTEAFAMIYDFGGVLAARPERGRLFDSEAAHLAAIDEARVDRAWELHPLVGAFVQSYGVRALAMLTVEHPDRGGLVRRGLEREWMEFVERNERRDAAALASGRRRELTRGPRRLGASSVPEKFAQKRTLRMATYNGEVAQ